MVRIKHRYLLFNLLYPGPRPAESPAPSAAGEPPSYVHFCRPSPQHVTAPLLLSTLRNTIQHLFGDHGLSVTQSSLRVMYFAPRTSTVVLRVPRAHVRLVWASLTFLDSLPGAQRGDARVACVVRVVRVSGTIRKSEEEIVRRARADVVRARSDGLAEEQALLHGLLSELPGTRWEPSMRRGSNPILDPEEGDDLDVEDVSD